MSTLLQDVQGHLNAQERRVLGRAAIGKVANMHEIAHRSLQHSSARRIKRTRQSPVKPILTHTPPAIPHNQNEHDKMHMTRGRASSNHKRRRRTSPHVVRKHAAYLKGETCVGLRQHEVLNNRVIETRQYADNTARKSK